jgi:transcriptional regulator with XRE-family HTH domain
MTSAPTTFGRHIAENRKSLKMSQKELAARIQREDGTAISPQYLNDIEHDRRHPSSDHLVRQFAEVLQLEVDYLYYLADRLPEDIRNLGLSQEEVSRVMQAFRKGSRGNRGA